MVITDFQAKLVLALVLEHQQDDAWKCTALDELAFQLSFDLFGTNGQHISPSDVSQLRNEAIVGWHRSLEERI